MKPAFTLLLAACLIFALSATAQESGPAPIPTHILFLEGKIQHFQLMLSWSMEKNETFYRFEVQKSKDGKNFTPAGVVFASDKADAEHYIFKNRITSDSCIYYRLKVVNNHKVFCYSNILAIKAPVEGVNNTIALLQNPVVEQVTFNYTSLSENDYGAAIYSAAGIKLYTTNVHCYKGLNVIHFKPTLLKGAYILELKNKAMQSTVQFIKN